MSKSSFPLRPLLRALLPLALALPMARHEPEVAFIAVFASVACFGARLIITLLKLPCSRSTT